MYSMKYLLGTLFLEFTYQFLSESGLSDISYPDPQLKTLIFAASANLSLGTEGSFSQPSHTFDIYDQGGITNQPLGDIIIIIIITRPWPAFGRQGLVGSSFEYSYTRLASRLRRSARSGIMTLGKDKTPSLLEPSDLPAFQHSNIPTFRPSWGNDKTNYFNLPTF